MLTKGKSPAGGRSPGALRAGAVPLRVSRSCGAVAAAHGRVAAVPRAALPLSTGFPPRLADRFFSSVRRGGRQKNSPGKVGAAWPGNGARGARRGGARRERAAGPCGRAPRAANRSCPARSACGGRVLEVRAERQGGFSPCARCVGDLSSSPKVLLSPCAFSLSAGDSYSARAVQRKLVREMK